MLAGIQGVSVRLIVCSSFTIHCHCGLPAPKGCSVLIWMKVMGPCWKEYLQHTQPW